MSFNITTKQNKTKQKKNTMSDYKYYVTESKNLQHVHPYQKLQKFAQMTIKAHYSNHELYETFLDEWEFQINEI